MSTWKIVPFLLVLTGLLCPAAEGRPAADVNNTPDVYQAEEHSNVTLTLVSPVNASSDLQYIDVMSVKPPRSIYWYHSKFQPDPYTDELFQDRLQCDLQLVENKEIRCLLTDLRLSDAGLYQWIVFADGRSHFKQWKLVVRAVMQQTQEEPPKETQRTRVGLIMAVCLFMVAFGVLLICFAKFHNSDPPDVV